MIAQTSIESDCVIATKMQYNEQKKYSLMGFGIARIACFFCNWYDIRGQRDQIFILSCQYLSSL